jgi:hypothetical protein
MGRKNKRCLTSLILSFKVKKPDSDTTPAKGEGHMRPVRIEIAPPVIYMVPTQEA